MAGAIVSPGMAGRLREWLAADKAHTMKAFAEQSRLSLSIVYAIFHGEKCRAVAYDKALTVVPVLWDRNYCTIDERPGGPADPKKIKAQQSKARDYTTRHILTPSLDSFAGLPGGWL